MNKKSNTLKKAATAVCMSAIAFCAATVTAQWSALDVQAASSRYQLVWSDEFNGTSLNKDNWNCEIGNGGEYNGNPGWGNNERQYYTDREQNVKVSNGTLKITAIEEKYEGYAYTSARIQTAGKQDFKYGKMEARMKLPAIEGVWPAFWMLGDFEPKGWPYCGEIDIMESWNSSQFAQGAFHWYNDSSRENKYLSRQINAFMTNYKGFDKTQWHTYAIEWNPKQITWLVDDKEYWTLDISDADKKDEAGKYYYFVLNLAVGGNLPYVTPTSGTLPVTMEVDYVRAYQLTNSSSAYKGTWKESSKVSKYTVKLTNGTKTTANTTVYDGDTVVVPTLTKRGYTFGGFYYTKNGKQYQLTSTTRIRANVTAKAKWTKVKVKKAVISSIKGGKKLAKLKFKAISGVKGYQIKYSTKKTANGGKTMLILGKSVAVPKLKSGTTYYFKARAYKLDSKKKKVYGTWSKVKSVTVK